MASYKVDISGTDSLDNLSKNPESTSSLSLAFKNLYQQAASMWKALTSLSFRINILKFKVNNFAALINSRTVLSEPTQLVDLSVNNAGSKTGIELHQLLSSFAEHLTTPINTNNLPSKNGTELKISLANLSAKVTFLDLSAMQLFTKPASLLREGFSGIHYQVDSIDLSDNELYKMEAGEFKESFSSLQAKPHSLYLCFNELNNKNGAQLQALFKALPPSLRFVDLSYNQLGYKKGSELKLAFSGFHSGIQALKLSRNDLAELDSKELQLAFSALSPEISSMDFSDDKSIKLLNLDQLISFLQTIPLTVKSIDLRHNKILKGRTIKQCEHFLIALKELDPSGQRFNIAHNGIPILGKVSAMELKGASKEPFGSILLSTSNSAFSADKKQLSKFSFFSQPSTAALSPPENLDQQILKP